MEGPTVARGKQLWQPYMVQGTIGGAVFGPATLHMYTHTYIMYTIHMYIHTYTHYTNSLLSLLLHTALQTEMF